MPGYRVIKQKDPDSGKKSLMFEVDLPQITDLVKPKYRIMSTYEQRKEEVDPRYQYLLVAGEPYETIAFKIPSRPIDFGQGKFFETWDTNTRKY